MRGLLSVTETRTADEPFALEKAWRLNPQVALRDESFGGAGLSLRQPASGVLEVAELVALVSALHEYPSAAEAIGAHVPEAQRASYERALARLAASEVIDAA